MILHDDGLVEESLQKRGLTTARVSWSDANFDWNRTRYALFRSTWDYFYRFAEFRKWLTGVAEQTKLINPHELIEWNLDKHYLNDLSAQGINVVPTHYTQDTSRLQLKAIVDEHGWGDVVIKPTISGTAMDTHRIAHTEVEPHESLFSSLCDKQIMMVQPFQRYIIESGEISLIVIGGQFTHALKKVAKAGDFRVQSDFGGTAHPHDPTEEEIAFAEQTVRACQPMPYYARVDVIYDNTDQLSVVELELIEPELWFRRNPPAAQLLADAIARDIK